MDWEGEKETECGRELTGDEQSRRTGSLSSEEERRGTGRTEPSHTTTQDWSAGGGGGGGGGMQVRLSRPETRRESEVK